MHWRKVLALVLFAFLSCATAPTGVAYGDHMRIGLVDSANDAVQGRISAEPGSVHNMPNVALERVSSSLVAEARNQEVRIVVELDALAEAYLPELMSRGLVIGTWAKNLVQGIASYDDLIRLAQLPRVVTIQEPSYPILFAVTSEGVSVIGADGAQAAGLRGLGVRVAVIDSGFDTTNLKFAGNVKEAKSFRADGDVRTSDPRHGTAVAEIIVDVAPAVELYLYNVGTNVEFINAVEYAVQQNVNIISISLGFFNAGPHDGTSSVSQALDDARSKGVLPIVAVGNEAQTHWSGSFSDSDKDGWHNFVETDETNGVVLKAGQVVETYLSWNAWPVTNQNFDLYLYNSSFNIVASSTNAQTGSQSPTEKITFTAPAAGTYHISIRNVSATRSVSFHIYVDDATPEYVVAAGSVSPVGDARGAVSVGAFDWSTGQLESFSSQGPTEDGRIKPDIVAPDGVSTISYAPGLFAGTSAAAPHTSGVAALLLGGNAALTASDLQTLLEKAAVDAGALGKDNEWGAGKLQAKFVTIDASPRVSPLLIDGQRFDIGALPVVFVWADGSTHTTEVLQTTVGNETTRFRFAAWSDGSQAPSRAITFSVGAGTLVAQFSTQYRVQVTSIIEAVSGSGWYDSGARAVISTDATLIDHRNRTRSIFIGWTGAIQAQTSSVEIIVNAPKTIIANWVRQYLVAILSVYGASQGGGWHDQGTLLQISIESTIDHGNQTRRLFTSWTGDAQSQNPVFTVTVDGPKTLQASWKTQYLVQVSSPYGVLRGTGWHDQGVQVTLSVTSPVDQGNQTRRLFVQWTGAVQSKEPTVNVLVDTPKQLFAEWKTQYFVRVEDVDGEVGGEGWYDVGMQARISAKSPSRVVHETSRLIFVKWSGDIDSAETAVSLTVSKPVIARATWKKQYFLKINEGGGEIQQRSDWFDEGSTVSVLATSPSRVVVNASRLVFLGWTGAIQAVAPQISLLMEGPKEVTALWKTQYFLRVISQYGSPTGEGWYDAGTTALAQVSTPIGFLVQQVFMQWSGDAASKQPSIQVLMDGSKRIEAIWTTDYTQLGVVVAVATATIVFVIVWRTRRKSQI